MKFSKRGEFPGICPKCGSTNVTMSGCYRTWHPTGPNRTPRLGDPGTERGYTESECHNCNATWWWEKDEKALACST